MMKKSRIQFLSQVFLVLCIFQITICQGKRRNRNCLTPDGQNGQRSDVRQCKTMVDFLSSTSGGYSKSIADMVQKYIIEYVGDDTIICCPPTAINIHDQTKPTPKSEPPDVSNHKNLGLLSEDCGYLDTEKKIKNGVKAGFNEFPWMALLSYKTGDSDAFECAGTIINEKYILTAAHCLNNSTHRPFSVRIGEYDISKPIDYEDLAYGKRKYNDPVQDVKVEEIIPYPGFDPESITNDIGLIRVAKMNLSIESARPVCLPFKRDRTFRTGVATGWGYTSSPKSGGKPSEILLRTELPIIKTEDCAKAYKAQRRLVITNIQICAGGKEEKDVCGGDSGGPLHDIDYIDFETRYVQEGIVSYGPEYCGVNGYPAVFTRVVYFMDWILDTIKP